MAAERIARVDEELSTLGKSDGEITAVRARIGAAERGSLDAVDAELSALAADLDGARELMERAGARVPAVRGTFEKGAAAPASDADEEPVFQEAPWGEGGADPEGEAAHSLSADVLFGDAEGGSEAAPDGPLTDDPALSRPPPPPADVTDDGADDEGGLADLLEGGDEPVATPAAEAATPDFDISDATDMMSADEVEAIRTSVAPGEAADEEIELLDDDELEILVEDDDL